MAKGEGDSRRQLVQFRLQCLAYAFQQVCVEPRPSVLNMTLPAFAAERRRLQQISIDSRYSAPAAINQQTRRRCCRSTVQTDGQTDGRTDTRPLHRPYPTPRTLRTAPVNLLMQNTYDTVKMYYDTDTNSRLSWYLIFYWLFSCVQITTAYNNNFERKLFIGYHCTDRRKNS